MNPYDQPIRATVPTEGSEVMWPTDAPTLLSREFVGRVDNTKFTVIPLME